MKFSSSFAVVSLLLLLPLSALSQTWETPIEHGDQYHLFERKLSAASKDESYISVYENDGFLLNWFHCKQASFNIGVQDLSRIFPTVGHGNQENNFRISLYDNDQYEEQRACKDPSSVINPGKVNLPKSGIDAVLIERGECSFVEKVKNAQKRGVKLVIIMDNVKSLKNVPMELDGDYVDIKIPTCGISLRDGLLLKKYIKESKQSSLEIGAGKVYGKVEILGPNRFEKKTIYTTGDTILFKWSAPKHWKVDLVLVPENEEEEHIIIKSGIRSITSNINSEYQPDENVYNHNQTVEYEYEGGDWNIFEWEIPVDFKSGKYYQSVDVPGAPFLQDYALFPIDIEANDVVEEKCVFEDIQVTKNNLIWKEGEEIFIDIVWTSNGVSDKVEIELVDDIGNVLYTVTNRKFDKNEFVWFVPAYLRVDMLDKSLKFRFSSLGNDGVKCTGLSSNSLMVSDEVEPDFKLERLFFENKLPKDKQLHIGENVGISWAYQGDSEVLLDIILEIKIGNSFSKYKTILANVEASAEGFWWSIPSAIYKKENKNSLFRIVVSRSGFVDTYKHTNSFMVKPSEIFLKEMSFSKDTDIFRADWDTKGEIKNVIVKFECLRGNVGYLDVDGKIHDTLKNMPNVGHFEVILDNDLAKYSSSCFVTMHSSALEELQKSDPSLLSDVQEEVSFGESFSITPGTTPQPSASDVSTDGSFEDIYIYAIVGGVAAFILLIAGFASYRFFKNKRSKERGKLGRKKSYRLGKTASAQHMLRRTSSLDSHSTAATNSYIENDRSDFTQSDSPTMVAV